MRSTRTCLGRRVVSRDMSTPKHAAEGADCSKETTEFVNQGLILWNESRQKWVGNKKITSRSQFLRMLKLRYRVCMVRKLRLCCLNTTKGKHKLLNSSKPFPRPVPLGEMVGFLVNLWEDEGMYEMV